MHPAQILSLVASAMLTHMERPCSHKSVLKLPETLQLSMHLQLALPLLLTLLSVTLFVPAISPYTREAYAAGPCS